MKVLKNVKRNEVQEPLNQSLTAMQLDLHHTPVEENLGHKKRE